MKKKTISATKPDVCFIRLQFSMEEHSKIRVAAAMNGKCLMKLCTDQVVAVADTMTKGLDIKPSKKRTSPKK